MRLRGVNFGPVLDAAGVRNFFGEGYRHHKIFRPDLSGSTFVAKTTTFAPKVGNMHLKSGTTQPAKLLPDCIHIKPLKGAVLNSVGLSGPGARVLLEAGEWQKRKEPFFISFMSVEDSKEKRLAELQEFARMLREYLPDFKAPVGLQVNFSCPNVGLEQDKLTSEITDALDVLEPLGLPLMPKLNVLAEPGVAARISRHRACDGICVSNTIPWGKLPEKIKWEKLFDSRGSPLARYGGGGLSGKPLLPLVAEWVHGARKEGLSKLINAGGGILKPKDVDVLYNAGASSVFVGSIAILRPHRVGKTVKRAHNLWRVP